jgi:hypothetical protein
MGACHYERKNPSEKTFRAVRSSRALATLGISAALAGCHLILGLEPNGSVANPVDASSADARSNGDARADTSAPRDSGQDVAPKPDANISPLDDGGAVTNCKRIATISTDVAKCDDSTSFCSLYFKDTAGAYVSACWPRSRGGGALGENRGTGPGQCADNLVAGPDWVAGYRCAHVCSQFNPECPIDFYCQGLELSLDGTAQSKDGTALGVCVRCNPVTNRGCAAGMMCGVLGIDKAPTCVPIGTAPLGGSCVSGADCAPSTGCLCNGNLGSCAAAGRDAGSDGGSSKGTCVALCYDYNRGKVGGDCQVQAPTAVCSSLPGQAGTAGADPPLYSYCKVP